MIRIKPATRRFPWVDDHGQICVDHVLIRGNGASCRIISRCYVRLHSIEVKMYPMNVDDLGFFVHYREQFWEEWIERTNCWMGCRETSQWRSQKIKLASISAVSFVINARQAQICYISHSLGWAFRLHRFEVYHFFSPKIAPHSFPSP